MSPRSYVRDRCGFVRGNSIGAFVLIHGKIDSPKPGHLATAELIVLQVATGCSVEVFA